MSKANVIPRMLSLVASVLLLPALCFGQTSAPETVLATYRVKPEKVNAFLDLMPAYWAALRSSNLVLEGPHVVLQGEEHGKPVIVEIFSWRDHDAPEHVSGAIQHYWDRINEMVEDRDGHSGIEFPEMKMVNEN